MPEMKEITNEIKESAHKVWLAGLGALAVTEEEGSKLFNNLVSKGEKFESRSREELGKVKDKAKEKTDEAVEVLSERWSKVEKAIDDHIGQALDKMGLPSRREIRDLSDRVEELTAKLAKLETKPQAKATKRKSTARKTASKKTSKSA